MKAFLDNQKWYKKINLINNLISFLVIIFCILTIVLYQYKIALTYSILLIPFLFGLLVYIYRNIYRFKNNPFDFKELHTYLNIDTIIYFIVMILGFSLTMYNFSSLYLLIAFIISFVYQCILFEIENKILNNKVSRNDNE